MKTLEIQQLSQHSCVVVIKMSYKLVIVTLLIQLFSGLIFATPPAYQEEREDPLESSFSMGVYEEESDLPSIDELFVYKERGSLPGWHNIFESTDYEASELKELRTELIRIVKERRANIPSPRGDKKLRSYKKGFIYSVYSYRDNVGDGAKHREWLKTAKPSWPDFEKENPEMDRVRFIWEIFRQVSAWEGDTSAMNSYDDQYITVGPGFSAISNHEDQARDAMRFVGKIYSSMPEEFKAVLYEHGLRIGLDNLFHVFDPTDGKIYHGNEALKHMRSDEGLIRLMILLAQSDEKAEMFGQEKELRQWMLEAQFNVFLTAPTAKFPEDISTFASSPNNISRAAYAAHLQHGGRFHLRSLLGLSWDQLFEKAKKGYPGREEEMKHVYHHHKGFYRKFPLLYKKPAK